MGPPTMAMLTTARLGLAVAALGYSSDKVPTFSVVINGEADLRVEQIVLLARWSLLS
jgi:hypothetical protein